MFSRKAIQDYVESDEYDFKTFKIQYNDKEKKAMKLLSIEKDKVYDVYGTMEDIDMNKLNTFLNSIGTNDMKIITQIKRIILRITRTVAQGYKTDNFWLTIRVTTPNNGFDIPRWHKDGTHLPNIMDPQPKFATVLKGPGTMLVKGTEENNAIYQKIVTKMSKEDYPKKQIKEYTKEDFEKYDNIENKYRKVFNKAFKDRSIQVKKYHSVIFFGGNDREKCAIHSEPVMNQPRLFLSIVPYSKQNIELMKEKYKHLSK